MVPYGSKRETIRMRGLHDTCTKGTIFFIMTIVLNANTLWAYDESAQR